LGSSPNPRYLTKERGFLKVWDDEKRRGKIAPGRLRGAWA
jgi:hypothetical protein